MPLATAGLLLLLGGALVSSVDIDPMKAAQNKRVSYEQDRADNQRAAGITAEEAALADAVLREALSQQERPTPDSHPQLMYIGNSQTYLIMDRQPGDMSASQWLQLLLRREQAGSPIPVEVHLGSLPNLTMSELLIRVVAAGERRGNRIGMVVAMGVLAEFRSVSVRPDVLRQSREQEVVSALRRLTDANPDLAAAKGALTPVFVGDESDKSKAAGPSNPGLAARMEDYLQKASEITSLFANRNKLKTRVGLAVYNWRNQALGITSSTPRPVPDAVYQASLELVELMFRYAKANGIKVAFYMPPIRPVTPNPNVPADVARYRRDLPDVARRNGAIPLDYIDLIPDRLWTNYPDDAPMGIFDSVQGQKDFAHFTGQGNKILAERLIADVGPEILRWAAGGGRR